jgi:DNA-binding CsgD family transcriptional regulator
MAVYAEVAIMRGRAALGLAVGSGAVILLLLGLELVAPQDVTLGALVLLLVFVSALLLDERRTLAIVVLAAATRAIAAGLGDIPAGLAVLECASFVAAAGAVLAFRRATAEKQQSPASAEAAPAIEVSRPASRRAIDAPLLTEREREVLTMAVQGLTAAQVAERLFISKRTVETHLERSYSKLGVRSKRELIASAFDESRSLDAG